jgi:6-phosphogluconate dehydrogenase
MASFGVIGLGVMGENLALNVEEHGFPVAVWNLETDWTDKFIAKNPGKKLTGAHTLADLVKALERPRRILIMIKAGAPVDMTLEKLAPLLEPGDMVIDGGNSWYEDTLRRQAAMTPKGIHFIGMGVSGGEEGARRGPSLMPGGEPSAWQSLKPILEAIAAKTSSGACVTWVGSGGSGHFVKMVHNGIEYGDMQLIAEAYDLLSRGVGLGAGELAEIFERWNHGQMESFLVELTAKILTKKDDETGKPLVDLVEDAAGQKGTGKWTAQVALDLAVPIPTIASAIEARFLSALRDERQKASAQLPGPSATASRELVDAVGEALYASKLCSYAQGMALIRAGSDAQKWNVDLVEMARIWKGGCIIRARLLDEIMRAFRAEPALPNLLLDGEFKKQMAASQAAWRRVVAQAAQLGVPVPAMAASLAYYDGYRSARLPQNLTQAQRDAFGAHTYRRIDHLDRGFIHTDWV